MIRNASIPLALALGAALAGCGSPIPQAIDRSRSEGVTWGPLTIPDRPAFAPRRPLEVGIRPDRRLAYTASDIRWVEVAVYAQNTWVYDEILTSRTRFRALNVPTGYAWVFLVAFDANGYNIVNNADGYVYNLVNVRNGTISGLKLTLPLI